MAAQEAKIRVRLDTSGAKSDLNALYGDMRRAPGIPTAASAGGPAGSAGGGGGGGGGFALGPILAKLTSLIAAQQLIGSAGNVALSAGKDALRGAVLGGHLGSARSALSAREDVAGRFGLAYKLGLVSRQTLEDQFDISQEFGAGARQQGQAQVRAALAKKTVTAVGSDAATLGAEVVPFLGEILEIMRGVRDSQGKGGP